MEHIACNLVLLVSIFPTSNCNDHFQPLDKDVQQLVEGMMVVQANMLVDKEVERKMGRRELELVVARMSHKAVWHSLILGTLALVVVVEGERRFGMVVQGMTKLVVVDSTVAMHKMIVFEVPHRSVVVVQSVDIVLDTWRNMTAASGGHCSHVDTFGTQVKTICRICIAFWSKLQFVSKAKLQHRSQAFYTCKTIVVHLQKLGTY